MVNETKGCLRLDMIDLVSIIIPCYNIENEIRFCINSLLNQRYKNLELIIIDDGSSDGTYKVCEELAVYDSRIKLIKQKNKGVSEARNKGLREASGNLICFVDGDDIVSEDYVSILVNNLIKYNADISLSGYTKSLDELNIGIDNEVELWSNKETLENFISKRKYISGVVCKLFRRKIVDGLFFDQSLKIAEDTLFTFQAIDRCQRIVFQPVKSYYYYQRPTSAMHSCFDERFLGAQYVVEKITDAWKERYPESADMFESEKIICVARRVQASLLDESPKSIELRNMFYESIKNCKLSMIKKYLRKKEVVIIAAEKYALPLMKVYMNLKVIIRRSR